MEKRIVLLLFLAVSIVFLLSINLVSASWYSGFVDFWNKITGRITGNVVAPECVSGADCPSGTGCIFVNEEYGKRCLDCASPYLCYGGPPGGRCGNWGGCGCGITCNIPEAFCVDTGTKCVNGYCNDTTGPGVCVESCTDTCLSLGKECGTHIICGVSTNCGADSVSCSVNFGSCSVTGSKTCSNGVYSSCSAVNPRISNCAGKNCGDDGCGGSCGSGSCSPGYSCQNGNCASIPVNCVPNNDVCKDRVCGFWLNGTCGDVSCGSCSADKVCKVGKCEIIPEECVPNCEGKNCGSDGCGGSCGSCSSGYSCSAGKCISGCVPSTEICDGKDNDCDSIIDEDSCKVGEACNNVDGIWKCEISCVQDCGNTECGRYLICGKIVDCGSCGVGSCVDGKCVGEEEIAEGVLIIYSTKSGYISDKYKTTSFVSLNDVKAGLMYYGISGLRRKGNGLIHYEYFDLSEIPDGAEVISAKLEKYHDTANIGTDTNNLMNPKSLKTTNRVTLGKLTENFLETDSYKSVGNRYRNQIILPKIDKSVKNSTVTDLILEYDVTNIVQSWIDGKANYGFSFLGNYNSAGFSATNYYFSNAVDINGEDKRPRLIVEYMPKECVDFKTALDAAWHTRCGESNYDFRVDIISSGNSYCYIDYEDLFEFNSHVHESRWCSAKLTVLDASINISTIRNIYNVGEEIKLTPGGN